MDRKWFEERLKVVGANQADIARAMRRDHTAVVELLQGNRKFKLEWVEIWADVLKVAPLDVLRHCYEWTRPIEPGMEADSLDVELLGLAIERAEIALRNSLNRDALFAGTIAHAYVFLDRRRRQGLPIDAAALAAVDEAVISGLLSRRR